jgi:hypothetical protein
MYKTRKKVEFYFEVGYFFRLKRNQKLAIINFLSVIAASDTRTKLKDDVAAFMDHCFKVLRVTGDEVLEYVAIGGREQTVIDIKKLDRHNLLMLTIVTSELCDQNGGMSDAEYLALQCWVDDLEMTIDEWYDYTVDENVE